MLGKLQCANFEGSTHTTFYVNHTAKFPTFTSSPMSRRAAAQYIDLTSQVGHESYVEYPMKLAL